jgi:zinc D-Ala-D-Ala carboxypeptidase
VKLSEHFTFAELTVTSHRSLDNTPDAAALVNLKRLAEFLELVKSRLGGRAVMITSGYRSAAVNAACGSRDTSQHRLGCAADIMVPGMTPDAVVRAVLASKLPFDQLIREFDRWTHVSIPNHSSSQPRRMALIIDKAGTRPF